VEVPALSGAVASPRQLLGVGGVGGDVMINSTGRDETPVGQERYTIKLLGQRI